MRRVFGGYLIRDCDKFHLTGVNTFTPGYELYRENVKMHLFASYLHNRSIWTRGPLIFPVQTWTIANLIWKRHYLVIDAFTSSFSKTSFSIVFLWTMAQTPLGNCRFRPFFIHTWNVTSPSSKIVRTIWKSPLSLSSFFVWTKSIRSFHTCCCNCCSCQQILLYWRGKKTKIISSWRRSSVAIKTETR